MRSNAPGPTHRRENLMTDPPQPRDSAHPIGNFLNHPIVSWGILVLVALLVVGLSLVQSPGPGFMLATALIATVMRARRQSLRAIGFRRPASWPRCFAAGVGGALFIHMFAALALEPMLRHLTGKPIDLTMLEGLRGNLPLLLIWLGLVWTVVVFLEEGIFRGFLMTGLMRLLGTTRAALALNVLLTSSLFGLAHAYQGISGVITTGVIGLVLATLFIRSGYVLWVPILVHGFIDTLSLVLIYLGVDQP